MMRTEFLIKGGNVVDGTGAEPVAADVLVRDGRIATIGRVTAAPNATEIDATGLIVAPGFIDIHSHSDFTLVVDPRAVSSIMQGVTLEVIGNCGHGCAPVGDPETIKSNCYGYVEGQPIGWRSIAEYLDTLQSRQPAVNVIYLVPNGNLRLTVASSVDRPSTPEELREMKRLLAQGMDEGAWGYSTGLEYAPERACPEEEIAELCRVAAEKGGFYATHTRNRHGEATQTVEEAIRTAAAAGDVPLQVSHISSITRLTDDGRAALEQAMKMINDACARGHDVAFDMHTRLFGLTNLSAVLPPSVIQGTKQEIAANLRSPSLRAELRSRPSIVTSLSRGGDWSRIVLYNCRSHPELARKTLAEINGSRTGDVFDTICEILLDEIDDLHGPMILGYAYDESDMRMVFDHPDCMVGSDATALALDGPLKSQFFHGAYTWAAWFFRHFVQEKKQMTLGEAVRRLTSLPAKRVGLSDRGVLREGAFADIAIFDPNTFAERGTTFEPNQLAQGMRHVIVNGELALRDGKLTGLRPGQVLRH
jgi:N-acyl-D-amino-acid deacylase